MYADRFDEGPQRGPRRERAHRPQFDRGPGGEGDPERRRFGGRGEGGGGGGRGRGESGRGEGGRGGRGHHGHHEHGPGFGPFGRGRGPWGRARRGDVRTAILLALLDEPMHGYQIMQRLEERSGGAWRPSAGSVYPTLQLLEDQGLVKGEEAEGRRVFSLTEAGKAEADKLKERLGDSPWAMGAEGDPRFAVRHEFAALAAAFKQVTVTGSPDDLEKAVEIMKEARKRLYALLSGAD